jgi:hypothetical protein
MGCEDDPKLLLGGRELIVTDELGDSRFSGNLSNTKGCKEEDLCNERAGPTNLTVILCRAADHGPGLHFLIEELAGIKKGGLDESQAHPFLPVREV